MWVLGQCGAELTVGGCNCLPQYNYTVPQTGLFLDIRNGSCIRPNTGSLPWCIVDPRTCIGKYRLLPGGQAWDSCAIPDVNSAPFSPAPALLESFTSGLAGNCMLYCMPSPDNHLPIPQCACSCMTPSCLRHGIK